MADMIPVRWNKYVPAVTVRFIASWSIYNAGETAGFSAEIAQSIVESGRAVYVNPPAGEVLATEQNQAPIAKAMTAEEELAALGVDTSTKEDSEEEMRRKGMRRPPKDRMVKGSQTK